MKRSLKTLFDDKPTKTPIQSQAILEVNDSVDNETNIPMHTKNSITNTFFFHE